MNKLALMLCCSLVLSLAAAEPPRPAAFQIRLVLDTASADTEQLTLAHQNVPGGKVVEDRLNVQKTPLLDRSAVKTASVQKSRASGAPEIQIVFTDRGAARFAEVTKQHVGKRLAIVIDGKVYSAPRVISEITGGRAVISGSFNEEGAAQLASRLTEGGAQ
ncbi:MAG: hypothetical protein HYR88_12150 [Verrucomicrobia bacterium]|nr:hypothetical protein [Verrucomicrobiota bacterium]MBI3867193.1 hypothetical protein [Verrucomicrobiota bacterium]